LPFPATTSPLTALYQRVHEQPRPLSEAAPDVPAVLATVVNHSLQRHTEDRYESAQALGSALAEAATETWGDSWARDSGITLREIPFDVAPLGALKTASAPPVTSPLAATLPPSAATPPSSQASPASGPTWR